MKKKKRTNQIGNQIQKILHNSVWIHTNTEETLTEREGKLLYPLPVRNVPLCSIDTTKTSHVY